MPQETELKLSLRPQDLPQLLAHPLLAARAPHGEVLSNTYFDTPGLDLMHQRMAVRERRQGGRTLLTVKTAGRSAGGLSHRHEWEGTTEPGQFDFVGLVDDAALALRLVALAVELVPVFQTDFTRRSWWLRFEGAEVEVALDEGCISSPARSLASGGAPTEAILELELELKSGPENALLALARALSQGAPGSVALNLVPSDRSKAERGYRLFLNGAA